MQLSHIFSNLSSGEFSQLSIGGAASGAIDDSNYKQVVNHINLALTALFTRFNLRESSLVLAMQDGKTTYQLTSAFAVTGDSSESVRYILDTEDEPFEDDILKVEKVLDEAGKELSLNDAADALSVHTPKLRTLKVPLALPTQNLTVVYRSNHPKIEVPSGAFNPDLVDVELPESHLEALLFYVASRVNNPVGMVNEFNAGNNYFMKYETACRFLEEKGIQVDLQPTNMKLVDRGFA